MEITVTLSPSSLQAVTVQYATSSGTAKNGSDFTATSGTLTFDSGQTIKTIEVATLDDDLYEGVETFSVTLSEAVNAGFVGGRTTLDAVARIMDEGDTVTPVLTSVTVDGATLTLTYDTTLDQRSVPVAGDFSVIVDGVSRAVYYVRVRGSEVTLVLQEAVSQDQAVSVSYQPRSTPIRHSGGSPTEALADRGRDEQHAAPRRRPVRTGQRSSRSSTQQTA